MLSKIYIGIDESGSSSYEDRDNIFVMCAVVLEVDIYSELAVKVTEFLKEEGIKEIKYSKLTTQRSFKIGQILQKYKPRIIYVIKKVTPNTNIEDLYNSSILELASQIDKDYVFWDKNIQIDEMYGDRKQQQIKKKVLQRLSKTKTSKVQFIESYKSVVVQVADFYAGKKRSEELKNNNL